MPKIQIKPTNCVSYKNGTQRATVLSVDSTTPSLKSAKIQWHDSKQIVSAYLIDLKLNPITTLQDFRMSRLNMSAEKYNNLYGHLTETDVYCYDGAIINIIDNKPFLAVYNSSYSTDTHSLEQMEEILWDSYAKLEGGSSEMTPAEKYSDLNSRIIDFKKKHKLTFNTIDELLLDSSNVSDEIKQRAKFFTKKLNDLSE